MKSAGNEGVIQHRLQALHVHIFFAAPLRARHMAKPSADQHQSRVAVRECPHHAGSAADLTVQPLDHIVGADARPMLTGKIAVGQRLLNLAASFSFMARSSATTALALSRDAFLLSWAWIALSILPQF